MRATEMLKQEHRVVERALGALLGMVTRLRQSKPVEAQPVAEVLDFLTNFADRCHHAKEEEILFPRLEQRGIPRSGGPIGVMLAEHEQGRRLVELMRQALNEWNDQTARQRFCDAAEQYAQLLQQHIWKEDNVLFMLAERVIDAEQDKVICGEFERLEAERVGPGKHEAYHRVVAELSATFGHVLPSDAAKTETFPPGCGCAQAEQ